MSSTGGQDVRYRAQILRLHMQAGGYSITHEFNDEYPANAPGHTAGPRAFAQCLTLATRYPYREYRLRLTDYEYGQEMTRIVSMPSLEDSA